MDDLTETLFYDTGSPNTSVIRMAPSTSIGRWFGPWWYIDIYMSISRGDKVKYLNDERRTTGFKLRELKHFAKTLRVEATRTGWIPLLYIHEESKLIFNT